MYRYKMSSILAILAVAETLLSRVRAIQRFMHRKRHKRGAETVDWQPKMNSAPLLNSAALRPKKKRRIVQTSLCVNSKYIKSITDWLGSDDITAIGIHGMGGIGKTTLARHIYDQLEISDEMSSFNFHAIGWVSVGLEFTVYELQKQIAAAFEINLQGDEDESRRGGLLNAFLSRTNKKFILFLDELWSGFRRVDVGIPWNCKLIVVSRMLDVCRVLGCQKIIKIEPLTEEESLELLEYNMKGYDVSNIDKVSKLKKVLYDKSGGLPLAITLMANQMLDNALKWTESSIGPTRAKDLLNRLKLSYDRLSHVKLQHCFLYCASAYPKGCSSNKEELICNWIKEGLIGDSPSLEAQHIRGHTILNRLLDSCLLEACEDTNSIKMHDLVRRMALLIVKKCWY